MQLTTAYPMMRGPLTDKSFPEIIQLTQYIRQSFHSLQPSRRNTFFENISDYFYNLVSVKQQKIDDKEWKPFDTAFSELIQDDIQAKQNSAFNWLTRIYEIESLAQRQFHCLPESLQPIVLVHNNNLEKIDDATTFISSKEFLIPKANLPGPVFERALEPHTFQTGASRRITLSQISKNNLEIILNYLINGPTEIHTLSEQIIKNKTIIEIFQFADFWQISALEETCIQILLSTVHNNSPKKNSFQGSKWRIPKTSFHDTLPIFQKIGRIIECKPDLLDTKNNRSTIDFLHVLWEAEFRMEFKLISTKSLSSSLSVPNTRSAKKLQNILLYITHKQSLHHTALIKKNILHSNPIYFRKNFISSYISHQFTRTRCLEKCSIKEEIELANQVLLALIRWGSESLSLIQICQNYIEKYFIQSEVQYDELPLYYSLPVDSNKNIREILLHLGTQLINSHCSGDIKIITAYFIEMVKIMLKELWIECSETRPYYFSLEKNTLERFVTHYSSQPSLAGSCLRGIGTKHNTQYITRRVFRHLIDLSMQEICSKNRKTDFLDGLTYVRATYGLTIEVRALLEAMLDSYFATQLGFHKFYFRNAVRIDNHGTLYWQESLDCYRRVMIDEDQSLSEPPFRSYLQNSNTKQEYFIGLTTLGSLLRQCNLVHLVAALWIPIYFEHPKEESDTISLVNIFSYFLFPSSTIDESIHLPKKIIFGLVQSWSIIDESGDERQNLKIPELFFEKIHLQLKELFNARRKEIEADKKELLLTWWDTLTWEVVDGRTNLNLRDEDGAYDDSVNDDD